MNKSENEKIYLFGSKLIISNVDCIREEIEKLFKSDAEEIFFDLHNIKECDSHGLKLLMYFRRQAEKSGKKLIIYNPSVTLKELLNVTKLSEILTIREENGS